jgi:hypothetical protein
MGKPQEQTTVERKTARETCSVNVAKVVMNKESLPTY